ncbi:putative dehydrogenase-related protein [Lacticaseibacillus casei 21/1]|nr:putative dehydrogenase-related protein [Lacticaseibacillus casei 21/1]
MKIKNWGICGTGFIAHDFASKINREDVNLVGVYDINADAMSQFAEQYQIPNTYNTIDDMLQNPDIQGVYIGTPNATHYPLALKAVSAGKNVLCEKVFSLTEAQYDRIQTIAREKHVVVTEGVTMFYMPVFRKIKKMVEDGELGKLSAVNVMFGSCKDFDPANRFFSLQKGGGALFDIGTYALSSIVFFMGTSTNLLDTEVVKASTGVDEKSSYILENDDNVLGTANITFRGKMPKQIVVSGSKGYVVITNFPRAEKATIYWNDGTTEPLDEGDENNIFDYEIKTLNQYAEENYSDNIDTRLLTKRVLQIMDSARGKWGLSFPHEDL